MLGTTLDYLEKLAKADTVTRHDTVRELPEQLANLIMEHHDRTAAVATLERLRIAVDKKLDGLRDQREDY